jgi:hypothetical protein
MTKKHDLCVNFFRLSRAVAGVTQNLGQAYRLLFRSFIESRNFGLLSLLGQLYAPYTQNFEIQAP